MENKIESVEDANAESNPAHNEGHPTVTDLQEPKSPKKKKGLKFWLPIVLAILVVLGAAGYAIAVYLKNSSKPKAPTPTQFSSVQSLLDSATTETRGKVPAIDTTSTLGGIASDGQYVYYIPAMQVPGYNFQTQPTAGSGTGNLSTAEVAKNNYSTLKGFFVDNHFKLVKENPPSSNVPGTNTIAESYAVYDSDQMRCAIWNVDRSTATSGDHLTAVSCAKKSDYVAAAKAALPFYTAYTKYDKPKADDLVFGPATISTSGDYDNAVVYQEDANQYLSDGGNVSLLGYYYKKKSDTEWINGLISYDIPKCDAFDTDVLKAAFTGVSCFDPTTKSSRKL